jgi:hypothetical protein
MNQQLYENAVRLARKIPLGKKTEVKAKAVHEWLLAVKEMLASVEK